MSLSNFVVFFISALSHFPSANFTNTHTLQELQIRVKDIWCLHGLVQLEMTNWFDFVAWILRPKSPFRQCFSLFSLFARKFFASFLLSRFAHWNWNQEKKLPGIIKVFLWTLTFYLLPPSPDEKTTFDAHFFLPSTFLTFTLLLPIFLWPLG